MKHKGNTLTTSKFKVRGMVCGSCEKIVLRQARKVEGVKQFKVDYASGEAEVTFDPKATTLEEIQEAIEEKGYSCALADKGSKSGLMGYSLLLGLAAILIGAYILVEPKVQAYMPSLTQDISLPLLFVIGLFTGFHCIAMCGGFVLSYATDKGSNSLSHLKYGFAKTLSYAFFGAVFGFIGSFFTFTPQIRGFAAILAGVFLTLFGLNMLNIFSSLKRFRLKMPSFVDKWVTDKATGSKSPAAIGLLNGLMIACGPLQAIYVLAAASGSPVTGASYLLAFGLGTLPVLLGFGVLTSFMSSKLTHNIVRYSGVLVILLGLIMVNRGFALSGSGLDLNTVASSVQSGSGEYKALPGADAVVVDGQGYQVIHMNVTLAGWQPDNFVLKTGVPVKWVIDGQQIVSCNSAIQVPKYGLRFDVKKGLQTITFTPTESGTVPWSCWMGMIPGTFTVRDDVQVKSDGAAATVKSAVPVDEQALPSTVTIASGNIQTTTTLAQTAADPPGYQTIRMNVTYNGWEPAKFVLKTGVPVKWIIDGQQLTGCNSGIKVPQLGLSFNIKPGLQTIEFTPAQAGTIPWSCLMGMIQGTFIVQDNVDTANPAQVKALLDTVQKPTSTGGQCGMMGSGGGGCGCGMMR